MALRQFGTAAAVAVSLAFAASPAHAVIEIQWWHAMTGANNDVVNRLAEEFNASQSDYKVVPSYKGNYPDACSLQAALVTTATDSSVITQSMFWDELMGRRKLEMDTIHRFSGNDIAALGPVSHVKLNICPDGGVSRLRIFGRLA